MEAVIRFDRESGLHSVAPGALIDVRALTSLLEEEPLLIPVSGDSLSSICQGLGMQFCERLEQLLASHGEMGGYISSWEAYQAELALEELFHGQPRCPQDSVYSVALGCSSVNVNSLTRTLGFLALPPPSSASAGLSPPPIHFCKQRSGTRDMVLRAWRVVDHIRAQDHVLGADVVEVLVGDLFRGAPPPRSLEEMKDPKKQPLLRDIKDSSSYEALVLKTDQRLQRNQRKMRYLGC